MYAGKRYKSHLPPARSWTGFLFAKIRPYLLWCFFRNMVIYRHKDKYSIREMCRFFEVSRSGYYGYVSRMEVPAWDLPLAENFFSILKTERIYRVKLQTYEEARLLIDQYIYFYNNQRIQLKTKLTPLEKRCQFVC